MNDKTLKTMKRMDADYATLLARHNALERQYAVACMVLAQENDQRNALLELSDPDEWRAGVKIGRHLVQIEIHKREIATLQSKHNALVEAVAWEREFDEVLVWLVQTGRYPRDMAGRFDLANERECARVEVGRLMANETEPTE